MQNVEFGTWEQKTCYAYAASTCAQTATQTYRTVCNSGYVLENSKCIKPETSINNPTPVAICGDGVKTGSEECDRGFENGACPATCNNMCRASACEKLPTIDPVTPPGVNPETPSSGVPVSVWLFGIGLVLTGLGAIIAFTKRR